MQTLQMTPAARHHRGVLTLICLGCTLLVVALHLGQRDYENAERRGRDWLATGPAALRAPVDPRIVFLAIDDASKSLDTLFADDLEKSRALQLMKRGFPWNREVYAQVIDRLAEAGAKAIIFDLVFPNPREGDAEFRAALERHGDRVAFGSNLKDLSEDADAAQTTVSKKPAHILPTPALQPAAGGTSWLGFVNVRADPDQIVRRVQFRTSLLEFFGLPPTGESHELLSLPARGLEKAGCANLIPQTRAPVAIRFAEEIRPRSLHEIFVEAQWEAPPYNRGEFFRGKIVLVGAAGNESEDRLQTPLGVALGPMIHLSAINAALSSNFLTETTPLVNLALIAGAGALAWIFSAWIRRPMERLALGFAALIGFYVAAQLGFNRAGLLPIVLSPALAFAGSGLTWSVWEQVLDRAERRRMRRTLERYVSRDVVRDLLDNPASFLNALGGVRKCITVLFSDVRGFTTMTEEADAQELVAQLNEYFSEMVRIVFSNQGTLDKFIGDAVMAHWGSIVSEGVEIDAQRAVRAAVEMRAALRRLNEGWRARGMTELRIGVGVNHGEAIAGNIGASGEHEKMEFTVIGDAVNLASRLEGVTKEYGVDICLGERAAELARGVFVVRSLDRILVKGKTKPVEVFAVLGERAVDAEPAWLARHVEAVALYRSGDFAAAETAWREMLAAAPEDAVAPIFIARCAEMRGQPTPANWSGVFEMRSK